MRVAVLAHSFPRFPGDTHGPFVKHLSEALSRRGHDMWALIPFDPELGDDPDTPLRIRSFRYVRPDRLHRLGYSRTLHADVGMKLFAYALSPLYFLFAARALAALVRRERIDLVHAHWLLPNGFVADLVRRATGVPFAVTLHGSDVFMAERNSLFRAMAARATSGASHITSCSGDLRDRLIAIAGGAAATIRLLPNGTELDPAGPTEPGAMRARLQVGDRDRLVVAIGRLVYKKGFRYLLEAMAALAADQRLPPAVLALGGGGVLEAELRDQAAALGVADRVRFLGALAHHEVIELIAAADVFAMPSVRDPGGNIDGLPIVVLEAMAAGKPVVATDVAGMPLAVADGTTGLLVPEQDPAALARALAAVLADPARADKLGSAGRARVACELNWDAIAGRHDDLYRRAVGGGVGPA